MVRVLPFAPLEAFSVRNRLELDALLGLVSLKAPHEVQPRRLLHVLLKVMEGVLSHVNMVRVLLLHSPEGLQLPVLEINDVRSQVVQEGSGVRGANSAARVGFQPVLKPPEVIL